jgi:hypothetical protein
VGSCTGCDVYGGGAGELGSNVGTAGGGWTKDILICGCRRPDEGLFLSRTACTGTVEFARFRVGYLEVALKQPRIRLKDCGWREWLREQI